MQSLAMMRIRFENGAEIELYYASHLKEKVTTDPYQATIRATDELAAMITEDFGSQYSATGPVWVYERVLVYNNGVL